MTTADYVTDRMDTARVAPPRQRRAWREHVRANHGLLDVDYRRGTPSFAGSTRVQRCGAVQLVEFWSEPIAYQRDVHAAEADGDDGLRVLVPLRGELRVVGAAVARRLPPGTAAAVSMERGFRIEQEAPARAFVLTLPRSMWPAEITGAPTAWDLTSGNGAVFAALVQQLAAERTRLDSDAFVRACEAAALVMPRVGGDLVTSARTIVRQHSDSPTFGPAELAAILGWSLRSVQHALHEVGTSPAALIREQRLERAAARLRDPAWRHRSIAHVAHASGFGSLTAFNDAFRARFGHAPSELRDG